MTGTGADLLRQQLLAAKTELERGEAEALEVAMLAGMLARTSPSDDVILGLALEIDDADLAEAVDQAADGVMRIDEDDDPAESWDALSSLDEVCAAAAWLGTPDIVAPAVTHVVQVVRAFPHAWRAHAGAATSLLQSQPPLSTDPANRVWAAIEASVWHGDEVDEGTDIPWRVRERLGLSIVVELAPFLRKQTLLAATEALPEEPPWRSIARESGWELAITTDVHGLAILLLSGEPSAAFEHEGVAQAVSSTHDGLVCAARPGAWRVVVGSSEISFRVSK